jgi:hypothetical protein
MGSSLWWFRRFGISARLSNAEKRKLVKETQFGVNWINDVAKQIAEKSA